MRSFLLGIPARIETFFGAAAAKFKPHNARTVPQSRRIWPESSDSCGIRHSKGESANHCLALLLGIVL